MLTHRICSGYLTYPWKNMILARSVWARAERIPSHNPVFFLLILFKSRKKNKNTLKKEEETLKKRIKLHLNEHH